MKKLFISLYLGTFFVIFAPKMGALGEGEAHEAAIWILSNGVEIHSSDILRFKDATTLEIFETLEREGLQFIAMQFKSVEPRGEKPNDIQPDEIQPNVPEKYILKNEEAIKMWKGRIGLYHDQDFLNKLYGFYVPIGDRWHWNIYNEPLFILSTHIEKSQILHEYLHYLCDKFHTDGLGYVIAETGEKISYKHEMSRELQKEIRRLRTLPTPAQVEGSNKKPKSIATLVSEYRENFNKKLKRLNYEEEVAVSGLLLEKFNLLGLTEQEVYSTQRAHFEDFRRLLQELK